MILNGLGDDYFDESVATIKSITPGDIRSLADKYLQPEKFYELIVV
jgi:predicted Zn-dependent peptidase